MPKKTESRPRKPNGNEDSILVVTDLHAPPADTRDLLRSPQRKAASAVFIGAERLAESMKDFASKFGLALESIAAKSDGFELDEVTIAVELTAEGEVALLGSGVSAGGKAGIELKFKRVR